MPKITLFERLIVDYSAEIKFLHEQCENILRRRIPIEDDVQQMIIVLYSSTPPAMFSSSGEQLSLVNQRACNEAFRIFGKWSKPTSKQPELQFSLFPDSEIVDKQMQSERDRPEKIEASEIDDDLYN